MPADPVNYTLVAVLVLGAVGLFLALPRGRANVARLGLLVLAAGAGVLVALLARQFAPRAMPPAFVVCSLVGLFAAVRVITHTRAVYSALYFVLLILAVTGLIVLLDAAFVAAVLVIVYAGAILVTYVFVIMLAQQSRPAAYDTEAREPLWGTLAGFALLAVLASHAYGLRPAASGAAPPIDAAAAAGTLEHVGTLLLTQYVIGIQLAGLLLLAAMVGAVAIARRKPLPETGELREGG